MAIHVGYDDMDQANEIMEDSDLEEGCRRSYPPHGCTFKFHDPMDEEEFTTKLTRHRVPYEEI